MAHRRSVDGTCLDTECARGISSRKHAQGGSVPPSPAVGRRRACGAGSPDTVASMASGRWCGRPSVLFPGDQLDGGRGRNPDGHSFGQHRHEHDHRPDRPRCGQQPGRIPSRRFTRDPHQPLLRQTIDGPAGRDALHRDGYGQRPCDDLPRGSRRKDPRSHRPAGLLADIASPTGPCDGTTSLRTRHPDCPQDGRHRWCEKRCRGLLAPRLNRSGRTANVRPDGDSQPIGPFGPPDHIR